MFEFGNHGSHFLEGASLCQPARKFHVALFERPGEAAYAVSVLLNVVPLGLIQNMPRIGARITERLDQREKTFQGMLKKDVALPKSIVRVDEQSQPPHARTCASRKLCRGIIPPFGFPSNPST
jgi:hypothetical protein